MCLGIPGEIVALETDDLAWVEISGVRRQVSLACLLDEWTQAQDLLGQWVLVHVGFAMSLIDRDEAQRTLALLQEMQQIEQESENAAG